VSSTSPAEAPARRNGVGGLRAPATRDQVDAYRFGLRRMEAALVRGDPVPLHEQIRAQRRAALAGVVLGLLGLCGAAVWALLAPSPDWWHESVVIGTPSGAMYAVAHRPDRLVPVTDLPAARLVLAALRAGGSAGGDPGTATARAVPDASIVDAPRTSAAAVPGAVAVTPEATIRAGWALCDTVDAEGGLLGTTVIGDAAGRPPVAPGAGVLVGGPGDTTWLVIEGLRHRVDVGDGAVRAAFRLINQLPRAGSAALVSALPEGPALATPVVPGREEPAPAGLPGRVGDVLSSGVGEGQEYFVVLEGGLQEVPSAVADLLLVASDARQVHPVGADVLSDATFVDTLKLDGWPTGAVRIADPADAPVTCWTWTPDRQAGDVWFGRDLPVAAGVAPVALTQADGAGERVDAVAVGAGGAVRATGPGRAPGAGPLWLVSATGVAYGVASEPTAAALGITTAEPAPEAALRLLPTGPTLDLADASRAADTPASP
jgi:type VII secretion protein EccB